MMLSGREDFDLEGDRLLSGISPSSLKSSKGCCFLCCSKIWEMKAGSPNNSLIKEALSCLGLSGGKGRGVNFCSLPSGFASPNNSFTFISSFCGVDSGLSAEEDGEWGVMSSFRDLFEVC